jgi:hypothetical protein
MTKYIIRELPNLDDPDLLRCCVAVQEMRGTATDFIQHIVTQLGSNPVTTANRAALAMLQRMVEGALSIEILCMKNRVRDAAVLIVSLLELQLDLQYIANDLARAETWIDHVRESKKPWSVRSQLEDLYPDKNELDAEIANYRQYSMVKHCNPAGLSFSFPIAVTRNTLQLDLAKENSHLVRIHLFGLAVCIYRAGDAASRIWSAHGLDVGAFAVDLKNGSDKLSRFLEEYIISVLKATQHFAKGT